MPCEHCGKQPQIGSADLCNGCWEIISRGGYTSRQFRAIADENARIKDEMAAIEEISEKRRQLIAEFVDTIHEASEALRDDAKALEEDLPRAMEAIREHHDPPPSLDEEFSMHDIIAIGKGRKSVY